MGRLPWIAIVLVLAAACGPSRAPLRVHWSFDGKSCDKVAVDSIRVDVSGEILSPDQFACNQSGQLTTGADLGSFLQGTYDITVQGLDSTGAAVYSETQSVRVGPGAADVAFDEHLTAIDLLWTFGGKTCAQAGITTVHVTVDGQALTDASNHSDLPCSQGGVDGVSVGPLSPGNHSFVLSADDALCNRFDASSTLVAQDNQTVQSAVDLPANPSPPASAQVTWTFGSSSTNCTAAGVDHIRLYLDRAAPTDAPLYETACTVNGVRQDSVRICDVANGPHSFAVEGAAGSTLLYATTTPVTATFSAPYLTPVTVNAPHQ